MAMRITDKQRAYAKKVALEAFSSLVELNAEIPELYPLEGAPKRFREFPTDWEGHFRRNDITAENKEALETILYETYEQEYLIHMANLYTPKTYQQFQAEEKYAQDMKEMFRFMAAFSDVASIAEPMPMGPRMENGDFHSTNENKHFLDQILDGDIEFL